jgi:hypothetical protein
MLLICGALAGPFFTVAWFLEGILHVDYDPLRHAISSLSRGEFGWAQDVNFIVTAILTFALALGVWRALQPHRKSLWALFLLTTVAIGFLGSSFFTTDPLMAIRPEHQPWLCLLLLADGCTCSLQQ